MNENKDIISEQEKQLFVTRAIVELLLEHKFALSLGAIGLISFGLLGTILDDKYNKGVN